MVDFGSLILAEELVLVLAFQHLLNILQKFWVVLVLIAGFSISISQPVFVAMNKFVILNCQLKSTLKFFKIHAFNTLPVESIKRILLKKRNVITDIDFELYYTYLHELLDAPNSLLLIGDPFRFIVIGSIEFCFASSTTHLNKYLLR